MRTIRLISLLAGTVLLSTLSTADCHQDHRSSKTAGLLVTDVTITGTHALSSEELSRITGDLIGSCFNESSEELEDEMRASFQNRGYLLVTIKNVDIKSTDPLTVPKPVTVEAEVTEGPRCKFGDIRFTGNHTFSEEKLRSEFPVKKGDIFERDKIASGLGSVIKLYLASGFLEIMMIPETQIVRDNVVLTTAVREGSQFRMGKLQIFAKGEQGDKLRAAWDLAEGAVFDRSYVERYVENNRRLLPVNFESESVHVVRDCRESTVEVRMPIDPFDPRSLQRPKDIDCGSQEWRRK
jgi:outer membrane protein assembly factor BamA